MADIARAAGVSMATASRALSDAPGVAAATRLRVRKVADDLAYVVSPEASALKGGKTGRVGVVVPHLSRWFFGEVLEGVAEVLSSTGTDLLLYVISDPAHRRRFFLDLPARRKVDAVLVVGIPVTPEERDRLDLLGVAIVAAGGQLASYPYVSVDDEAAGRQAMDHLLYLGHRRIAMLDAVDPNDPDHATAPVAGRAHAYVRALAEAGLPFQDELFVRVSWGSDEGASGMERLLSLPDPPTAVLAHSDEIAIGALRTCRRAGLRVPADISVMGIDDHPMAAQADLTTIHQDVRAQGIQAGRMLASVLAGETVNSSVVLPTRLVPRGSTGHPRAGAAQPAR